MAAIFLLRNKGEVATVEIGDDKWSFWLTRLSKCFHFYFGFDTCLALEQGGDSSMKRLLRIEGHTLRKNVWPFFSQMTGWTLLDGTDERVVAWKKSLD